MNRQRFYFVLLCIFIFTICKTEGVLLCLWEMLRWTLMCVLSTCCQLYFALAPKVTTTFVSTLLFAPNKLSLAFAMPYTRLAIVWKTIAMSNRTSLRENISSFKPILVASVKSNFQSTLLASTLHLFLGPYSTERLCDGHQQKHGIDQWLLRILLVSFLGRDIC